MDLGQLVNSAVQYDTSQGLAALPGKVMPSCQLWNKDKDVKSSLSITIIARCFDVKMVLISQFGRSLSSYVIFCVDWVL